jgi:Uma2 family endonuclease
MKIDISIDWNAEIATLSLEEKKQVRALLEYFRRVHLPKPIDRQQEEDFENENYNPSTPPYYAIKNSYSQADILEIVAKFPHSKKWTFADLQNSDFFPSDIRVKIELLDYKIFVHMDPKIIHQEILTNVSSELNLFVRKYKLGKTFVAPTSIKMNNGNVLKPDILYISESKYGSIKENYIDIAPELVIEILSRSNYKKLRNLKKQKYADFGVQEYWEINPTKKQISIEIIDEQTRKFILYSEAKKTGKIESKVLKGFVLDVEDIITE